MESLALLAAVIIFTSLIGGPTALLLTFVPDQPRSIRIIRTIMICVLSLVGILFGVQLAFGSSIPAFPKIVGIIGLLTSITAVLYEFKILKRKGKFHSDAYKNSEASQSSDKKIYAVIFSSKRQDANYDLYYEHNNVLEEKIKSIPGYLKHLGIRHPESRQGVTVAYFDSLEAIDKWRKDEEHMDAKKLAKSNFYENYQVEITEVIDKYGWCPDN